MLSFSLGNIIFQFMIMIILFLISLAIIVIAVLFIKKQMQHAPEQPNKEILDKLDEISKKLDQRK